MSKPMLFTNDELLDLIKQGYSQRAAAKKLNADESTVRGRLKTLKKRGWAPEADMTKVAPEGFHIKGTSTLYGDDGQIKAQWVKTNIDKEQQLELFKEALEAFKEAVPQVKPSVAKVQHTASNLMAVYPLGDPHVGMLAWEDEVGENWDLKKAEEVFCSVFDRIVKSAPSCDEAVIVNLGDFFHYDNLAGVTTRSGHTLDTDGRYAKMIRIGVKIIRYMIAACLEHHKRVRVINAIGNHDDTGAMFLAELLYHVYENDERVIIDHAPSPFHYVQFGKVLIGAHHGHTCKMDRLPGVMAADKAKEWGETNHRYWLTGHIHHDSKREFPGCTVESFRTLAAKDSFAAYGGWRSGRDTKCLVMHNLYGEIERHTVSIDQLDVE